MIYLNRNRLHQSTRTIAIRPTVIGQLENIKATWYFHGEPLFSDINTVFTNRVNKNNYDANYGVYQLAVENNHGRTVAEVWRSKDFSQGMYCLNV